MAKNRYSFDETFFNALQNQLDRNQKENQFKQKVAFEMRQMNLLNDARQERFDKAYQLDKAKTINAIQDDYLPTDSILGRQNMRSGKFDVEGGSLPSQTGQNINKQYGLDVLPEGNFIQKSLIPTSDAPRDLYEDIGTVNVNGRPIIKKRNKVTGEIEDFGEQYYKPDKDTDNDDKGIFFDVSKSDKLARDYGNYTKGNIKNLGENRWQVINDKGEAVEVDREQLELLKSRKMEEVTDATNNEARRINEEVPGFYKYYQSALNNKTLQKSKDRKQAITDKVNQDLKTAPSEVRDAMKNLLMKRLF